MSSLGRTLAQFVNAAEARRFVDGARDSRRAQAELWAQTHSVLSDAPFWRGRLRHRLAEHDVTSYETYAEAIAADEARTVSSLSGDPVLLWAESAGTTKVPKRFPLTERYRRQFQRLNPPYLAGLLQRYPGFARAPVLYFAGLHPKQRTSAGIDIGYISNFNYRRVPSLLRRLYAIPPEVLRDDTTFTLLAPAYAMCRDLSAIFAIAPNRIAAFVHAIEQHRDSLLALLEGRQAVPDGLPPLRIDTQRLQLVKEVLTASTLNLKRLWPGLSLIGCWKSSVCALQLPLLETYVAGNVPIVDAIYSATEGWFTVPDGDPNGVGGALHCGAIITEFFPVGEAPTRHLLQPHELEIGGEYEIVVTNLMGLVRYRLYDVVRCTGYLHQAPRLEFVGKVGAELLVGLSRFSEAQLVAAAAPHRLAAPWLLGVNATGNGVVLYHAEDATISPQALVEMDAVLCGFNDHYRDERASGGVVALAAQPLPRSHTAFVRDEHAQTKPRCFVNQSFARA